MRKQVTVLFCDVVDYTSRSVSLDPEDLADEIRVFRTLCTGIAKHYHGHIANYFGDGILVLFGHPISSEFDPEHAVRAGLEMVAGIERNNASAQWRGRQPIRIRVGIATGLVVVGERAGTARGQDESIFGEAPNLAARLQSLAAPNTVVTALRTRRLVGGAFKFRDLGEHRVKGFQQPINAWQILHESAFQNRSTTSLKRVTTRFVSRRAELRWLQENYEWARRGHCRIIHLSGDPGIGKSRLLRAFEKTIHKQNLHRLRLSCSPYFRAIPFKPIVDETNRWLQLGGQHDFGGRRENMRRAMVEIGLDGRDEHSLFNELLAIPMPPGQTYLDLSAEEKHHRTVDTLARVVIRLSRLRPLFLVVEDLHWADPATLKVLGGIIACAGAQRLFGVFTSRTGFALPWPAADLLTEFALGGLDADASGQLIAAVFGARPLSDGLKQTLIRRSAGVPLFLEESSWHLRNQMHPNQIRESDAAGYDPYSPFAIPDTLQDSLNARLDHLGAAKTFAQLAAVFGGDFRYSLISKIAAGNGINADFGLNVLLEADLISVLPDAAADRYEFRHVLFRDAAYYSLLRKTRQQYHLQIAELLQRENPGIGRQHPESIAYHYAHTSRIDLAVNLWRRAGEQALAQSDLSEALQHLSSGLKLVDKLPEDARRRRELALLLNLGVALTARSGYHGERVTRTYEQALALAEAVGSEQQAGIALYGMWRCMASQAAFSKSLRALVKLKSLSGKSADPELKLIACGLQGLTQMVAGKFAAAEAFCDQAIARYDPHRDRNRDRNMGMRFGQNPYTTIRGLGAINKLLLNKVAESATEIDRTVEIARAIGHPYTLAETLRVAAMYRQITGDLDQLAALAEEVVTLASTHGFEGLLATGKIFQAFCRAHQHGDATQTRRIQRNLKCYEEHYGQLFLPYFHSVLAQAHLTLGDHPSALRSTQQALNIAERNNETWAHAPLLSLKTQITAEGELAANEDIEQWWREGMEIARAQGAKFVVARLRAWRLGWGWRG